MMVTTKFKYKNHRGQIEDRQVSGAKLQYLYKPGSDYQPGWFVTGFCLDRQAPRAFALHNIILPDFVSGSSFTVLRGEENKAP